jgi:hypothetical protein
MLRNRMQHHAGRRVIWQPLAMQPAPSSAVAALGDGLTRRHCDRQSMTDPCNSALLLVSPGASPPFATIVGIISRISTQRASPSAICQSRLFPIALISASTPVRPEVEDGEPRTVAVRTTSCRSSLAPGAIPTSGRPTHTSEASAFPTLTPEHQPLRWPEDCHSARLRPAREAMGSSDAYQKSIKTHSDFGPCDRHRQF